MDWCKPTLKRNQLSFDETNFVSIAIGNSNYAEPLKTSVLWTDATQVTGIEDNDIGYNGRTVDRLAAGAYTPEPQILPPTDLARTLQPDGVHITWTNVVQAGYENTSLYWEDVSVESAFETAKAVKTSGVTEHIIPWGELSAVNLWYLRARHTAV